MKPCRRFTALRSEYEREINFMIAHSQRHAGKPSAKSSAKQAASAKTRMAKALSGHVERCLECS